MDGQCVASRFSPLALQTTARSFVVRKSLIQRRNLWLGNGRSVVKADIQGVEIYDPRMTACGESGHCRNTGQDQVATAAMS